MELSEGLNEKNRWYKLNQQTINPNQPPLWFCSFLDLMHLIFTDGISGFCTLGFRKNSSDIQTPSKHNLT